MADPDVVTGLLQIGLALFFVAAFALPGEAAYGLVFYVGVLLPLLLVWRRLRPARAGDYLALALVAWSALTLMWGEDAAHRAGRFAIGAAATAAFLFALSQALGRPATRQHFGKMLIWAGSCNAAFVLLAGLPAMLRGERLLGWGVTRHPVLGGSVMALPYLTALWWALTARNVGRRACYAGAAALMGCFILAMQSRGALLAALGGTSLLLAAGPWRWRAMFAGATALACWVVVVPAEWRRHLVRLVVARGTSHRFEIWQTTWSLIRQRPLFGHGLAANVPPSATGFPHSLYLSLLFYSGAIGFSLFAALAFVVTARLVQLWRGEEGPWLAALWLNGLLAGLTDLGQITKGPGPLWFIFWLPAGLILAAHVELSRPAEASGPPAPAN